MRNLEVAKGKLGIQSQIDDRLIIVIALVLVWGLAAAIFFVSGSDRPTPQSIAAYLGAQAASSFGSARDRDKLLNRVAGDLKILTAEQRADLWQHKEMRAFFGALAPEEQEKFFELIWPRLNELMEAFNKLPPSKRSKLVEQACKKIVIYQEAHPQSTNDPVVRQIIAEGFQSFYSTASADSKMDVAPLIDEMQQLATRGLP